MIRVLLLISMFFGALALNVALSLPRRWTDRIIETKLATWTIGFGMVGLLIFGAVTIGQILRHESTAISSSLLEPVTHPDFAYFILGSLILLPWLLYIPGRLFSGAYSRPKPHAWIYYAANLAGGIAIIAWHIERVRFLH